MNNGILTIKVIDTNDSTATTANIILVPESGKQKQDSIGSYTFVEVKPGDYTVIARSDVFLQIVAK